MVKNTIVIITLLLLSSCSDMLMMEQDKNIEFDYYKFNNSVNLSLYENIEGIINENYIVARGWGEYNSYESLIAKFKTNGKDVRIGNILQKSNITVNNFYNPLNYTIQNKAGEEFDYTVSITINNILYSGISHINDLQFGKCVVLSADGSIALAGGNDSGVIVYRWNNDGSVQ